MPLTKEGRKVLRKFKEEYGEEKGKEYFYRYMNKNPEKAKKLHKTRPAYTKKI